MREDSLLRATPTTPTYAVAMAANEMGISVLPIKFDGTKQPSVRSWANYQSVLPSQEEIAEWFSDPRYGLAVVTGAISGNLEALDFDDGEVFRRWVAAVRRNASLNALYEQIASGYEEVSPSGGRHLLYLCEEIAGSQKLAMRSTDDPARPKTLAETRGNRALLIIDPSRGSVHPSGKPYRRVRGSVRHISHITSQQRHQVLQSVRAFNELPEPVLLSRPVSPVNESTRQTRFNRVQVGDDVRPGDLYNQQASWREVLEPHGWRFLWSDQANVSYWTKGKGDVHATTNYGGNDLLYVFSTATPFENNRSYNKFGAYAVLKHQGDLSAASRELYRLGYCKKRKGE